jgi:hypothetical protein
MNKRIKLGKNKHVREVATKNVPCKLLSFTSPRSSKIKNLDVNLRIIEPESML